MSEQMRDWSLDAWWGVKWSCQISAGSYFFVALSCIQNSQNPSSTPSGKDKIERQKKKIEKIMLKIVATMFSLQLPKFVHALCADQNCPLSEDTMLPVRIPDRPISLHHYSVIFPLRFHQFHLRLPNYCIKDNIWLRRKLPQPRSTKFNLVWYYYW